MSTHVDRTPVKDGKFALPSNTYDVLKDLALIYIPAFGVLYVALAAAWGWGYQAEVTATAVGISTFLGVCLKISTASYNNSDRGIDGVLNVDQSDPRTDRYGLDMLTDLAQVAQQNTITLRVNTEGTSDPSSQH